MLDHIKEEIGEEAFVRALHYLRNIDKDSMDESTVQILLLEIGADRDETGRKEDCRNALRMFYELLDMEQLETPQQKADMLHHTKQKSLEFGLFRPSWWYRERNRLNWLGNDPEGGNVLLLKHDLGGWS